MQIIRQLRKTDYEAVKAMSFGLFGKYNHPAFELTDASMANLCRMLLQPQNLFRGLFIEDELVAWLGAVPGHGFHHSSTKGMSQIYYHANLEGKPAVKAMLDLHRDFHEQAEQRGNELVVSSSFLPNADKFTAILIGDGWELVCPGRVVKITKFHFSQTQRGGAGAGRTDLTGPRRRASG